MPILIAIAIWVIFWTLGTPNVANVGSQQLTTKEATGVTWKSDIATQTCIETCEK